MPRNVTLKGYALKTWFEMKSAGNSTAEISIYDEIGAWGVTAKDFITEFKALSADNITLFVNSPGGSVFDALAIYNTISKCGKKVTAKVMGVAASAASFIVMAADHIEMPENSFLMIHNPMGMNFGNADDMREMAEVLDKMAASLTNVYVARSGQPVEKVKELLDAETWLTADEAKELGFCDEVTANMKLAACFEIDRLPENIQGAFKAIEQPEPPVENEPEIEPENTPEAEPAAVAFADQVNAKMENAGFSAYASLFALNYSDMEQVEAAIAETREIVALCNVAGKQDAADAFIRARASVADVRASLLDSLAAMDEANPTDGQQPSGSSAGNVQPTASVTTASIWAARRN